MKLAFVRIHDETPELALWTDSGVLQLGPTWPANATVSPDPMAVIRGGEAGLAAVRAAAADAEGRPELSHPADQVTVLPPVPCPPRIFALARNYREHAVERGGIADREQTLPQVFMKPAAGTLNHHRGVILLGPESVFPDYEAELAVVVGRGGRHIAEHEALAHVFGYTVVNDVTERKLHANREGRRPAERDPFFDWLNGKWMDGSCPMGPCVVTRDAVPDWRALRITCHINDEKRQDERAGSMIHPVPAIITFLSSYLCLLPGDVIATGTPAGVGKPRGIPLRDGDVITTAIEGIGQLTNEVGIRHDEPGAA